jgi:hypothetical protein
MADRHQVGLADVRNEDREQRAGEAMPVSHVPCFVPDSVRDRQTECDSVALVVRILAAVGITMVLPNGHGFALVPQTVYPIEPLEMCSDRADRNT